MSTILCCSSISPYRPRQLDHEAKFRAFMSWAGLQTTSLVPTDGCSAVSSAPYAIQLVRQINYGPQESIRYFVQAGNGSDFTEATEDNLLKSNFEKVNSYKNFRCEKHNKFFEINLYQKNPINAHHWRVNLARPSRDIDLTFRRKEVEADSGKKAAQSAEQEEKDDLRITFPELRSSLSQTFQKVDEAALEKIQPANQPDIATLKKVLRFLLSRVGTSLGSSPLLSLLSLDWANAELALGLEFETLWKAELTSSNIIILFCDCFASYDAPPSVEVDLAEVEDLVILAMQHVESRNEQQLAGRVRLHEIVNRVLKSGHTLDWVSVYEGNIVRLFTSGPDEKLLERCQRINDRLQQDRSNRNAEEVH